jgi:hypothetical protein
MKIFWKLFFVIIFVNVLISCALLSRDQKPVKPRQNNNLLNPTDILDKRLSGSDKDGDYTFIFKENNILEYILNGKSFFGNWEYDSSSKIMRYKIDWNEDGNEKGYVVDIIKMENKILIHGYWYITNAYIAINKEVMIE